MGIFLRHLVFCMAASLLLTPWQIAAAQDNFMLTCQVLNQEKTPVAGATVHVLNTSLTYLTDREGNVMVGPLQPGRYWLSCSVIGYADQLTEVNLETSARLVIQLSPKAFQLDEVVVTAEKREAAWLQLPVSVTSFTATKVDQYRLWNSRDLSALSPNVYSTHSGDERNVTSIRGITTTSYSPAVTTYIDGVGQFSLDTYIASLLDVERIEILRGPQGTLYGRNAMGGVINIITKQPGNETKAYAELNVGNYGLQRHSVAVRLPLVKDRLFLGLATQVQQQDGYFRNTVNNTSFDAQRMMVGNYFLHFKVNSQWSIRFNAKQQQQRNEGAFPLVFGLPDALNDPYKVTFNATGRMVDQTSNASLIAQYDGPALLFTAQLGYQRNYRYYKNPLDGDFSALDAIAIGNNYGREWNNVKVWTQEFRVSNTTRGASRLQWTAGLYFFGQNNPVKQATLFGKDAGLIGMPDENSALINISKEAVQGQAVYGQVNYRITKHLSLITGLRFDREHKSLSVRGEYEKEGLGNFVIQTDTGAGIVFTAVSPKMGLQYQPDKKHQFYITWSRGFRPGGFTPMNSDPSQPPLRPYDPEYSMNAEAGVKRNFWEGKGLFHFAAFYSVVTAIQVPTLVLPDAITLIRNTGKMVSSGLECEGSLLPMRGLQMDYSFGWTQATYRSLQLSTGGQLVDLKGKKQLFTPARTGLLAVQYTIPLRKLHPDQFLLRGEWVHVGTTYFDFANTLSQPSYSLWNARIGWSGKKAALYAWGRNMGGKTYIAYAYDFGAVYLGNPRTYGLTLTARL